MKIRDLWSGGGDTPILSTVVNLQPLANLPSLFRLYIRTFGYDILKLTNEHCQVIKKQNKYLISFQSLVNYVVFLNVHRKILSVGRNLKLLC